MNVITLSYKSTNCYLIQSESGWIMIDAGWPDTLPNLFLTLMQNDISINDIKYLVVTHYHPDHAGLVQDIKGFGASLILHDNQVPFVSKLNEFFIKNSKFNFKDIDIKNSIVISSAESRTFLKNIGINGEIISTPGHSDDSITLVIDGFCAFTGDLPALPLLEAYNDSVLNNSWAIIQKYIVKRIYPAHGNLYYL